jgi:multidrug efflux system outer membrane protein
MRLAKTGASRRPGRPYALLVASAALVGVGLSACTTPARQVDVKLPGAYEAPAGKPLPSQALDQWWTSFDDPVLNDLITTALAQAPDARLAAARLASASGNLNINELALFPTLTLTPSVGLSKSITPSFLSPGSTQSTTSSAWSLGGSLSIPVLNIPKLMADIKAQGARVEQAAVTYEQTVQKAFGETESALAQLDADERRVTLLAAGERRAAAAYEANRKGYAMGLTDLTTALQAEQAWRGARTALTGAQTQALQRSVQTYKALGGGWSPQAVPSKPSAQ